MIMYVILTKPPKPKGMAWLLAAQRKRLIKYQHHFKLRIMNGSTFFGVFILKYVLSFLIVFKFSCDYD